MPAEHHHTYKHMDPKPATLTGTELIVAADHAQAMSNALNTAYWLEAAGSNEVHLIGRLEEAQRHFDAIRALLMGETQ